ncbi:MAG: helix-turn-helix transcriptional regulator [Treponema sp.]|uniref:helix-turn-helix domain-containing protein n=1 Tax=Treponema sp. TaxID=166 RepID=UPI0025D3413F|nr:helix-turn-helix transcriptional regulator [Treponema sp.]MBQ8681203.1 helix-turn-helix transcriptional regulator [Treponema sp.]
MISRDIHRHYNDMDLQAVFIRNLKMYRKNAKMTQAQLALQIDRSFNYINSVECAALFPPPDTIQKIAEVLNIRPMQLFDENASPANIITTSKEQFISRVSEKIYERLRADLKNDIAEVIEKEIEM